MSRNLKAAASGKSAQPNISAQLLKELIPGPVTIEQFEDIFQNFTLLKERGVVLN